MNHIIVGLDFSEESLLAVQVAQALAAKHGARVTLVHAFDSASPQAQADSVGCGAVGTAVSGGVLSGSLRERAEQQLDRCRREISSTVDVVDVHLVAHPSPAISLLDFCDGAAVDLIVVGTHGRTGLGRMVLGSVAERVVRHAPCPVLVVRSVEDPASFPRSIVAATDLSERSHAGLAMASSWAEAHARALLIVHVYDTTPFSIGVDPVEHESFHAMDRELHGELEQIHRDRFGGSAHVRTELLVNSNVAGALCSIAEERHTDLLVLTTLGRTGLRRLLIGGVTEKVVRHAPCSVLVVPVEADAG